MEWPREGIEDIHTMPLLVVKKTTHFVMLLKMVVIPIELEDLMRILKYVAKVKDIIPTNSMGARSKEEKTNYLRDGVWQQLVFVNEKGNHLPYYS